MATAELFKLQEQEIPEAMKQLQDSHANLQKVADYCEGYYIQASDSEKRPALEETRKLTTQSLASVAYQINTLATNFLSLLDMQTNQLMEMESSINHLAQTVAIHKEKVARREIGVLTTNKSFFRPMGVRSPGVIFPEQPEKQTKYVRKPIDYTILDSVGQGGVKVVKCDVNNRILHNNNNQTQPGSGTLRSQRAGSISSVQSGGSSASKPSNGYSANIGTLTNRSHYGTPNVSRPVAGPVSIPTVPQYVSTDQLRQLRHPSSAAPAPPTAPIPPAAPMMPVSNTLYGVGGMGVPPPPPPMSDGRTSVGFNGDMPPPPPPMHDNFDNAGYNYAHSNSPYTYYVPNMPPPPSPLDSPGAIPDLPSPVYNRISDPYSVTDGRLSHRSVSPPPPPAVQHDQDPTWVPANYMEKVVAIYDYEPQNDDELRFTENTTIYVITKNSDGWWEGVMASDMGEPVRGLFPENYVESLL